MIVKNLGQLKYEQVLGKIHSQSFMQGGQDTECPD